MGQSSLKQLDKQRKRRLRTYNFSKEGLQPSAELLSSYLAVRKQQELDERYYALLREGIGRHKAARALGLDPLDIKKRIRVDAIFAEKVELAQEEAAERVAEIIHQAALDKDLKAAIKYLEVFYGAMWGPKDQKITVSGEVTHKLDGSPILDQIQALQAKAQERIQLQSNVIDVKAIER